ncbi:MAG: riboflavin kinase / FMN adenylyltransferase [Chitinophagaceae bacterium]|nr:MAG: riboflavin kinase / FMN adenylyltransferase [Chitinophagaceae bacterium]
MKVHRELVGSLPDFNNAVVTIGTFDGVHIGHQKIIAQLKEEAARINGETVIITFHPHPRKIVSSVPGDIKLINTLAEKINLLEKAGVDHLVIVPFDHVFASLSAEAYINDFLFKFFHPKIVIIGYDHRFRFGKGRVGNYALLEQRGKELGFEVKEISEELMNEVGISSTKIRKAILENEIELANDFLGYAYFFEGLVIEGNKLGRTIGYPTANLHIGTEEKLIPGNGVYAVLIELLPDQKNQVTINQDTKNQDDPNALTGKLFKGMMNIGIRPTVDGKKRVIEVNIFDFDETIYDRTLVISIIHYLRGEVKFNGLDELKLQLKADKEQASKLLNED